MERLKKYWKPLATGFGLSILTFMSYFIFRKYGKSIYSKFLGKNKPFLIPLKKSEAMIRSNLIKNLKYTLFLQLRSDTTLTIRNIYEGSVLIEFDMNKVDDIFLDFQGGISSINLNYEKVELKYENGRIYLPKNRLMEQGNKLNITYTNHYSQNSRGVCNYIDPDDLNSYVYTDFEPFYAHTMFPCFDQPNMKAPIKLFVSCLNTWTVISTTNPLKIIRYGDEVRNREKEINLIFQIPEIRDTFCLFEFEETEPIATYTFAVCAGMFSEVEDFSFNSEDKLPPMKIYCRSFIFKAIDSYMIFKTAKEVLKWFKDNLTDNLPYRKFDFVFVPNLKTVAMENVGCITFDDKFLEPTSTPNELARFHMLIAHELAHTWFGNYVTPEWWDDLWLNESFASFLSFLALKQISENISSHMDYFHNIWLLFSKSKANAIAYDQYKTTHKVRDIVDDTNHAELVFDDITYYKGASILKYYYYVTGHELFFKGLKNYVNKYHGRNANYEQFKEILGNLTKGRDIETPLSIIEPFLDSTGVVRLNTEMKANLTHIEEFIITQNPCPHATPEKYYSHRMDILLIYNGKEEILYEITISNSHISKIKELENREKPSAVVLNAGDWSYFKQSFDTTSRDYLVENTYKIKDSTTRLVVARDLYEMIKDGTFDPESYEQFTFNLLRHEKDSLVVEQVLRHANNAITHFVFFDQQDELKQNLFNFIREDLFHKHKDIRKTLVNYLIDLIDFSNDKEIKMLIYLVKKDKMPNSLLRGNSEILDNIDLINAFDLSFMDDNLKQRFLETLEESDVLSNEEKKHFESIITSIEVMSSKSISIHGSSNSLPKISYNVNHNVLQQLTLEACRPNKIFKESLWNSFVYKSSEKSLLYEEYEASMKGFARKSQYKLLKQYFVDRFFDDFLYVKNYHSENYAVLFFENLSPSFIINEEILKKFINLSKYIGNSERKIKSLVEKTISQLQINLKVAKRAKHSPTYKKKINPKDS